MKPCSQRKLEMRIPRKINLKQNQNLKNLSMFGLILLSYLITAITWTQPHPGMRLFGFGWYCLLLGIWLCLCIFRSDRFRIPAIGIILAVLPLLNIFLGVRVAALPLSGLRLVPFIIFYAITFLVIIDMLDQGISRYVFENAILVVITLMAMAELIMIINWYVDWWTTTGTFQLPPVNIRGPGLFFNHANVFAGALIIALPIQIIRFLSASRLQEKILWLIHTALFIFMLYFTSSRSGWIGASICIAVTLVLLFLNDESTFRQNMKFFFSQKKNQILAMLIIPTGIASGLFLLLHQVNRTNHLPLLSSRDYIWNPAMEAIRNSPIVGHGMNSFGLIYAQASHLPPGWLGSHAHNLFLQSWVENGLIGLILTCLIIGIIFINLIHSWRSKPELRTTLTAYLGIFSGLLIQNQFDFIFRQPLISLLTISLLAIASWLSSDRKGIQLPRYWVGGIGLLYLGFVLFSYMMWYPADRLFWQGKNQMVAGDISSASNAFCEAAKLNQQETFFSFQCGLTRGYQANPSQPSLAIDAIQAYETGLSQDPYWAVNWLNLAWLKWETGDMQTAIQIMNQITENSPEFSDGWLNLGYAYEMNAQYDLARSAYLKSLAITPLKYRSNFFHVNDFRAGLADDFITNTYFNPTQAIESESNRFLWLGFFSYDLERYDAAAYYFEHSILANSFQSHAYAGLALAYHETGRFDEARLAIQQALKINPDSYLINFYAGGIALDLKQFDEAQNRYLLGMKSLTSVSYSMAYSLDIYHHYAPYKDTVPMAIHAYLTPEMISDLSWVFDHVAENEALPGKDWYQNYLQQESR